MEEWQVKAKNGMIRKDPPFFSNTHLLICSPRAKVAARRTHYEKGPSQTSTN
jgi:hypothetical protein